MQELQNFTSHLMISLVRTLGPGISYWMLMSVNWEPHKISMTKMQGSQFYRHSSCCRNVTYFPSKVVVGEWTVNIARRGKIASFSMETLIGMSISELTGDQMSILHFKVLFHKVGLASYTVFQIFKSSFATRNVVFIIFMCIFPWERLVIWNGLKQFLRKETW